MLRYFHLRSPSRGLRVNTSAVISATVLKESRSNQLCLSFALRRHVPVQPIWLGRTSPSSVLRSGLWSMVNCLWSGRGFPRPPVCFAQVYGQLSMVCRRRRTAFAAQKHPSQDEDIHWTQIRFPCPIVPQSPVHPHGSRHPK